MAGWWTVVERKISGGNDVAECMIVVCVGSDFESCRDGIWLLFYMTRLCRYQMSCLIKDSIISSVTLHETRPATNTFCVRDSSETRWSTFALP